jgi:hypothetical protein
MDFDGPVEVEGFVRADVVEDLPPGLGLPRQVLQRLDLQAVEVLVLQRSEGTFAHTVLAGALVAGPDVQQLGPGGDKRGERVAFERAAVVGDQLDPCDLSGGRVA